MYYDETAKGYEELHGEEQRKKLRIISDYLNVKNDDKLLDVGCGPGYTSEFFNCKIMGIDPSQELLANCSFEAILGKAEELPFKDNEFDVVISVSAIQNFDDIKKGLQEIKRVGKNNFALSILKRSSKRELVEKLILDLFNLNKQVEEDKDIIFFCE